MHALICLIYLWWTNIRFTNFLQSYSGCLHIFSMIQYLNEASEQISHMHFTRAVNIGIRQTLEKVGWCNSLFTINLQSIQQLLQFIPNVFDQVHICALCRPVNHFVLYSDSGTGEDLPKTAAKKLKAHKSLYDKICFHCNYLNRQK